MIVNRACGVVTAIVVAMLATRAGAQFGDWPAVFDPQQLLTLNLQMDPGDWSTIKNDESFSIEVPASFWANGEPAILVSVRRKSGDPLSTGGVTKVSYKIDINQFVSGQSWHGLKKLSLENGDDEDVVSEGLAWQMEQRASGTQGYGYDVGRFAWVRLIINGVDNGVYLNVEQHDKRFLENRGLYIDGQTWLYKVTSAAGSLHLKAGGPQDSATVEALCYAPFDNNPSCAQPDLAIDVPSHIDMQGILTELAADAFQANSDALLTNGKNFYFADFLTGRKRLYFPWDRDSSLSGSQQNQDIYGSNGNYAVLLAVPEFRAQYSSIMNDMVCGPWSPEGLIAFLDSVEPVLTSALAVDPNNQIGADVAEHFDSLRNWVTNRAAEVTSQIENFEACPTVQVDLNELMASNAFFLEDPVEPGEFPDWFELHNPSGTAVDLGGLYLTDDLSIPTKFQIQNGVVLPANGYLLFYADSDPAQGPTHTNFKLSASGDGLAIFDTNGVTEIDSILFGPQLTDASFGRFPNGSGPWGTMATPTPGAANTPPNPPPIIVDTTRVPTLPIDTDTVSVSSLVTDDSAVVNVTLHYNAGLGWFDVPMLDDGASEDGAAGDDVYGAAIPSFSDDTVVLYYVRAVDDLAAERTDPPNAPVVRFSYVVGYVPPAVVINEFGASNQNTIEDPDEPLAFEDWIELYNASGVAVDLGGMYLTDNLSFPTKYPIPAGIVIPSGGFVLFWADNESIQGDFHTNFKLGAAGEEIGLFDVDARGNVPLDTLEYGPQVTDVSTGRCPDGSETWVLFAPPTPDTSNEPCDVTPEACCLPGHLCDDLDPILCVTSGGIAQGMGSTCPVSCPECIVATDCDDGIICTQNSCDSATKTCQFTPIDIACSNGIFCDGAEFCDVSTGCADGPLPCIDAANCNEELNVCDGECVPPTVEAVGGRYFAVTPGAVSGLLAIRMFGPTDPELSNCVDLFVQPDGTLAATLAEQTVAEWGVVFVRDPSILPQHTYDFQMECGDSSSTTTEATTWKLGDVDHDDVADFLDIQNIISFFKSVNGPNITLENVDLARCMPDGIIDFRDIANGVDGFKNIPINCDEPCP